MHRRARTCRRIQCMLKNIFKIVLQRAPCEPLALLAIRMLPAAAAHLQQKAPAGWSLLRMENQPCGQNKNRRTPTCAHVITVYVCPFVCACPFTCACPFVVDIGCGVARTCPPLQDLAECQQDDSMSGWHGSAFCHSTR